jgi:hypothetical protein
MMSDLAIDMHDDTGTRYGVSPYCGLGLWVRSSPLEYRNVMDVDVSVVVVVFC